LEQLTKQGQINTKALEAIAQQHATSDLAVNSQDIHTMQFSSVEQLPKVFIALPQKN